MVLAATPESDRRAVIADHVRGIVATVFDCGVDDFGADDMLDDIGLDSMMAMGSGSGSTWRSRSTCRSRRSCGV